MKKVFYTTMTVILVVMFSVFWEAISAGGVSWEYDGQVHTMRLTGI